MKLKSENYTIDFTDKERQIAVFYCDVLVAFIEELDDGEYICYEIKPVYNEITDENWAHLADDSFFHLGRIESTLSGYYMSFFNAFFDLDKALFHHLDPDKKELGS